MDHVNTAVNTIIWLWLSHRGEPWSSVCGPGSMNSVYYLASCLFIGGVKNCTQAANVGLSLNGLDMLHELVHQHLWHLHVRYVLRKLIKVDAFYVLFAFFQSFKHIGIIRPPRICETNFKFHFYSDLTFLQRLGP